MILVLLGTQNNKFNRLLEQVDNLIKKEIIKEDVVVQAGYTKYETQNMKIIDFISKKDLEKLQEKATYVITHGGVGSIVGSLVKNKKVIAIPRFHKYDEHVNDHQKEIVELFTKKGYIIGIQDISELEVAIKQIEEFVPIKYELNNKKMLKTVEDFIDNI